MIETSNRNHLKFMAAFEPSSSEYSFTPPPDHSPAFACYHEPRIHDHELYAVLTKLNLFILLPIAVLGVIFNASALVFLYRPPKITSGVFVYLLALLILDHCQLIITIASALIPQICESNYDHNHTLYEVCMFERRYVEVLLPRLESTINTLHVWTIAALSAHRYWKISRPVVSRLRDTVRRAHVMLLIMFAIILIFRLPIFFIELTIKPVRNGYKIAKRGWATEMLSPYRFVYHTILDPLISNVIPFIWMSVFSLLTLYEIFRSRKFNYKQISFDSRGAANSFSSRQPLTNCFRKKAEGMRQKQELRATISIVLIILLYLILHSLQLFTIARKWQLILQHQCPMRRDYFHTALATILSMVSASVNAFVFIAFTNRLRKYVKMLLRKTSRTLSNSSEPPLSPKTTVTIEAANAAFSDHVHI